MFEQRFNSRPLSRSDAQDGAEIKNWGKESHPDLVGSHEEIGEKIKDWMNLFRGSNTSMQKKKNR